MDINVYDNHKSKARIRRHQTDKRKEKREKYYMKTYGELKDRNLERFYEDFGYARVRRQCSNRSQFNPIRYSKCCDGTSGIKCEYCYNCEKKNRDARKNLYADM